MYPVRLGYDTAIKRISKLTANGHHAESLITSVFTAEKTLRRTLQQLIISSGFKSTIAKKIIKRFNGIYQLIEAWDIYDPHHRKLSEIIGIDDIKTIKEAAQKRNKLIHGERVFNLETYKEETKRVLEALNRIKIKFDNEYNYSGWTNIATRKISKLHLDPKVKI